MKTSLFFKELSILRARKGEKGGQATVSMLEKGQPAVKGEHPVACASASSGMAVLQARAARTAFVSWSATARGIFQNAITASGRHRTHRTRGKKLSFLNRVKITNHNQINMLSISDDPFKSYRRSLVQ